MKKHRLRQAFAQALVCLMLAGSLTVSASAAQFNDVPAGHWAAGEISRCVTLGYFQGQAPGHFGLGESMTRSAFTVVMSRFFGWETPASSTPAYPDIPAGAWYSGAVQAAYDRGALTDQRDTFRPADPITREEMTVMLLRALGYSDLAGLSAQMDCPFEDVTKNEGYITLAYHLGLMNGTSSTTFAPDRAATREQVAVIFMRLYDKLHTPAPAKLTLLNAEDPIPDLSAFSAAAIPGGQMMSISNAASLQEAMPTEEALLLRDAAQDVGADALLHITVSTTLLQDKNTIENCAAALAQAVVDGEYDGLLLDVPKLRHSYAARFTQLAQAVNAALGEKVFYLIAEAPQEHASITTYDGYEFSALAEAADCLVLRFQTISSRKSSMTVAPPQPLEEIYSVLLSLKEQGVPFKKTALLLTSTATLWNGSSLSSDDLSAEDLSNLLAEEELRLHYSERYACAYLAGATQQNASCAVWYLDGRAAAERAQLLHFFGVSQVCLTDPACADPDFLNNLK